MEVKVIDNLSISIMFPCYNDNGTIITLIQNACDTISYYTDNFEIIVVDDFSTDGSREAILLEEKANPRLRVILHNKNMGYGSTIINGLRNAKKEYFFYTDGDGQYDIRDIEKLLKKLNKDTILVNGYKKFRSDPLNRIIIGNLYNALMKIIFRINIRDIDCDFRIIKRDFFDNITLISQSGTICLEIVKYIELSTSNIEQSSVNHYYREYGKSQFFNFRRLFKVFFHIIYMYYILMIKRS